MRWFDIRLANNYSRWIRIWEKSILEQIWKPDPYFVNSKHSYFHEVSFPNFRMYISPEGLIIYTLRYYIKKNKYSINYENFVKNKQRQKVAQQNSSSYICSNDFRCLATLTTGVRQISLLSTDTGGSFTSPWI